MMYKKIDSDGFYLEDVELIFTPKVKEADGNIVDDLSYVDVEVPQGFHKPKWNGSEWVEGMAQADIDSLKNVSSEPTEAERLMALETAMLEMIMGGARWQSF